MYCQHFSLKKKPFQISSDNELLWLGNKHATALKLLKKGITEEYDLVALTGDIGTGKTSLMNEIIHTLDNQTLFVKIGDPGFEMHHLFKIISTAFGFENHYKTGGEFSTEFFVFLKTAEEKGQKILVLVDEAQRIPKRFLKEIATWSGFNLNHVLTVMLVGQLEFQDILSTTLEPALKNRNIVHAFLEHLDEEETRTYINKRLEMAGATRKIFLLAAVHEVFKYSKGIPRLINISCDQALLAAFSKDMKIIDVPTFKQGIKGLELPALPFKKKVIPKEKIQTQEKPLHQKNQRFPNKKMAGLALACCLCLGIAYLFYIGYLPFAMETQQTHSQVNMNSRANQPKEANTLTPDTSLHNAKPHDSKPMEQNLTQEIPAAVPEPGNSAPRNMGLGYTPDPLSEPEPDAIIDWLMDKKNIKPQE